MGAAPVFYFMTACLINLLIPIFTHRQPSIRYKKPPWRINDDIFSIAAETAITDNALEIFMSRISRYKKSIIKSTKNSAISLNYVKQRYIEACFSYDNHFSKRFYVIMSLSYRHFEDITHFDAVSIVKYYSFINLADNYRQKHHENRQNNHRQR
mgnify:FL=1